MKYRTVLRLGIWCHFSRSHSFHPRKVSSRIQSNTTSRSRHHHADIMLLHYCDPEPCRCRAKQKPSVVAIRCFPPRMSVSPSVVPPSSVLAHLTPSLPLFLPLALSPSQQPIPLLSYPDPAAQPRPRPGQHDPNKASSQCPTILRRANVQGLK